jgi:hypothetical protein
MILPDGQISKNLSSPIACGNAGLFRWTCGD